MEHCGRLYWVPVLSRKLNIDLARQLKNKKDLAKWSWVWFTTEHLGKLWLVKALSKKKIQPCLSYIVWEIWELVISGAKVVWHDLLFVLLCKCKENKKWTAMNSSFYIYSDNKRVCSGCQSPLLTTVLLRTTLTQTLLQLHKLHNYMRLQCWN